METLYEYEFEEDDLIGDEPKEDLQLFLNDIKRHHKIVDEDLIIKGFNLCIEWHEGQTRASGKPYYLHPVKVATILINEMGIYDTASIIASLLHDTIEDVSGSEIEKQIQRNNRKLIILKEFTQEVEYTKDEKRTLGQEILEIVEAVTKIKHTKTDVGSSGAAETYRKLFMALVRDVRVILIKLADRLHNLRTLHYLGEEKQKRIGLETLSFYTPIARRLGLNRIKMELEDRSLNSTDKMTYEAIRKALVDKRRDFLHYIKDFSGKVEEALNENNLEHVLTIVHKHVYEIFKMVDSGKLLSEIDNFYSLVITIKSNDKFECYRAHGILVNAFNAVDRFVDHISQPKVNFYQSLNTLLLGPDGKLVEVLIRTEEMDRMAEGGIASNFSLSEGRVNGLEINDEEAENWGQWMQDMIEEKGEEATRLIWESIRNNIFDRDVTVFKENGEPVTLPAGACTVDFAFSDSEYTGLHCLSAKVNGNIKELDYQLKNRDKVFIITSPNAKPKAEWKNYIISHKAESALHRYFKIHTDEEISEEPDNHSIDLKLIVRGEDKPGMLQKITEAIGQTNIKRVSLDSSDSDFDGAIFLNIKDEEQINWLYAKLFKVKGIKSVEIEDVE